MRTTQETKFELPLSVVVYLFHITIVILEIISLIKTNKEKEKKRKARQKMSEEAKAKELEKAREIMEKVSSKKSHAQEDFDKIAHKHKMRERRKNRSGKEHLIDNLQAKI
jgi:uncharacterized damage-inducible protein DinB